RQIQILGSKFTARRRLAGIEGHMKKITFFLLMFWPSLSFGANQYFVDPNSITFQHDSSVGTFTDGGKTYGTITGVVYMVYGSDGNGSFGYFQGRLLGL